MEFDSGSITSLLEDDGSIDQALQELEGKLAAWFGAVSEAQYILKAHSSAPSPASPPETTIEKQTVSEPFATESDTESREVVQADESSKQEVKARSTQRGRHAHRKMAEEIEAATQKLRSAGLAKQEQPEAQPDQETQPEEQTSKDAQISEDEALLAELDPETRAKVQVMRRLNVGSKKSVKELLEQIRTQSRSGAVSARSKSWWRRKEQR